MQQREPVVSHVQGWRSIDIGDGVEAFEPTGRIQQAYTALDIATTLPLDCAIFSHYNLRTNIVTVYFSPSALRLAEAFGASPCTPPTNIESFSMLIGSPRAWGLLFHS